MRHDVRGGDVIGEILEGGQRHQQQRPGRQGEQHRRGEQDQARVGETGQPRCQRVGR